MSSKQLLAELDSIGSDNEGLFVLAATNQPWDVDSALRRPGRFDRTVLVLPPDAPARAKILEFHLRDRPVDAIDLRVLVQRSRRVLGRRPPVRLRERGRDRDRGLGAHGRCARSTRADLAEAVRRGRRRARAAWFDVARNFVTFANTAGEYDDLLAYMKKHRML